jgi:hypothetical protein
VTNATSVTIDNGVGPQPLNGSTSVVPITTTTYTLTAVGPGGTSTAQATVAVIQLATITFSANPPVIQSGGSTTLAWNVIGADSVTIDQGVGLVAAIGTRQVSPKQTTIYRLTATNAGGNAIGTATVTVGEVAPPKHRAVRH